MRLESGIAMMTSSNGNSFRVTGHLCGEFTGPRWIPRTKASDAGLYVSLICARINGWVNNREAGDLRRHPTHCDVIVMICQSCGCWCSRSLRPWDSLWIMNGPLVSRGRIMISATYEYNLMLLERNSTRWRSMKHTVLQQGSNLLHVSGWCMATCDHSQA